MLPKVCDSNVFIFVEASSSLELWTPEKVSVKLFDTQITQRVRYPPKRFDEDDHLRWLN